MKPVAIIKPKYIFLGGWFLTSIFILLNCHYDNTIWKLPGTTGVTFFKNPDPELKDLRKIILIVTFMRSGSSFLGEFFNLHPGKKLTISTCNGLNLKYIVCNKHVYSDCFYQFEPMRAFGNNYAGNNFDAVYSNADTASSFFKEKLGKDFRNSFQFSTFR